MHKPAEPDAELSPDSCQHSFLPKSEEELHHLPELPPFPVAEPPPLLGAQAHQSREGQPEHTIVGKPEMPDSSPACEACCEHSSLLRDETNPPESKGSLPHSEMRQKILDKPTCDLSPACVESCEPSSASGGETSTDQSKNPLLDETATMQEKLQLILQRLESSKLLNS